MRYVMHFNLLLITSILMSVFHWYNYFDLGYFKFVYINFNLDAQLHCE